MSPLLRRGATHPWSFERGRTQSPDLVLGPSLSEFMRKLGIHTQSGGRGGMRTLIRNQMRRLFGCSVTLIYEDEQVSTSVNSHIAERTEFWWNERKPDEPVLWDSKIRLGWGFFQEVIEHPVPLDMNTLTALKRCSLGLDLYLWLTRDRRGDPGRQGSAGTLPGGVGGAAGAGAGDRRRAGLREDEAGSGEGQPREGRPREG